MLIYNPDDINTTNSKELCSELLQYHGQTALTLHLNCPGGSLISAQMIVYHLMQLKNSGTTITVTGSGLIASAATLILLTADIVELDTDCQVLFHQVQVGGTFNQAERKVNEKLNSKWDSVVDSFFYSMRPLKADRENYDKGLDVIYNAEEFMKLWVNRKNKQ
jgi:ATP-dependent protease ClpP protease subunit